jgi:hypothetical protein
MTDRSPTFSVPSMFVISALSVLATPLAMTVSWRPAPERPIQPTVAQLLVRNEALAAAAQFVRQLGWDLTDKECDMTDDNAHWIEYARSVGPDYPEFDPGLRDALRSEPYWAVYFRPKRVPGWNSKDDGDVWVFVRRSDLRILGRI